MKGYYTILLIFIMCFSFGQEINYTSLDQQDPIQFTGKKIIYNHDTIELGPKSIFIDGHLKKEVVEKFPFVFNTFQDASNALTDGSESEPMVLYLAPWVYWIDDPDDETVRVAKEGDPVPYGMKINCEWLKIIGLNSDPQNVVLACNRGQTIGARGNFTMFRFRGDGISTENITFGNYCNVDLEFPLKPELSRPKRASAIVQAQLIHCNGDKIFARNTHFISRLNLCPFVGGKRILFENCHFECTDDALSGTAIYLNSTLTFFSSKPFYYTRGTGAIFLNCDIYSHTKGQQFMTKAGGQLAVIDTRMRSSDDLYVGWQDVPPVETRNYQHNFILNDEPYLINSNRPEYTIQIRGKRILNAYSIELPEGVLYNTYNLLKGEDDWDPLQIKERIKLLEMKSEVDYSNIPVQLKITSNKQEAETGKDTVEMYVRAFRFGNYKARAGEIKWKIPGKSDSYAKLEVSKDGLSCKMIPQNFTNSSKEIIVEAESEIGIKSAFKIIVLPEILPPPNFERFPMIRPVGKGLLTLDYELDSNFEDQSVITWYRCANIKGDRAIQSKVSRHGTPSKNYQLSLADTGYFLMAIIEAKHIRSDKGKPIKLITSTRVQAHNILTRNHEIHPDLNTFPILNQEEVIPGQWTLSPLPFRENSEKIGWTYGVGNDGAKGKSGLLPGRSGFLCYTPLRDSIQNMIYNLQIAPFKTAGQGFSIAPLYMDVLIKFDAVSLTGYGLRFIRTTKHGNAVDAYFVQYINGKSEAISDPVTISCYRTNLNITIEFRDGKLIAEAFTDSSYDRANYPTEIKDQVNLQTVVPENFLGGFGIWYEGGANMVITDIKATY